MGSKILVVDDEPDVAAAWARTLRLARHEVSFARDPASALELSRAHPFDLVILDYMMPSMSGIELLNEIRRDHPLVRSIIISGKLDSSVSEASVLSEIRTNIEADLYLHKPVENSRLNEAVAELLAAKPERDWQSIAQSKLEAATKKKNVLAVEKILNQKTKEKKK